MGRSHATWIALCGLVLATLPIAADDAGTKQLTHIAGDGLLVKLSAEAAARARELPDDRLPTGLFELDLFLVRHEIAEGQRVVRGRVIRHPEAFHEVGLDRLYTLKLPRSDPKLVRALVAELSRSPWVEYAEPVTEPLDLVVPDDPEFAMQWAHQNTGQVFGVPGTPDADIESTDAWEIETGDPSIIAAIVDRGFDIDHEDLVDNFIAGWDFVDDDPDPNDDFGGHATRVSGIAAARGNNPIGVSGVCWSCSLMPLRRGSNASIIAAITYAADNGASVFNMSFGNWGTWQQGVHDAVEYARSVGVLPVAGSGNDGVAYPITPAAYFTTLTVGASMNQDDRASLSTYGEHIDVVAPGEDVFTTDNEFTPPYLETYGEVSGTSLSTPFVTGLAALLHSHDPDLHVNELMHLIRLGADDQVGDPAEDTPGWDRFMGYGRINAAGSLALVDGPWLALDRPHYVCSGDVTVALKDPGATNPVEVTLTGDIGLDTETVTLVSATTGGYYEGTIPISWVGHDGPVVVADGKLDLEHGETITATRGGLSTTAFLECQKNVCAGPYRPVVVGDCDRDTALDPGELWSISLPLFNRQMQRMDGAEVQMTTSHPDVTVVQGLSTYGEVPPYDRGGTYPDADGSDDPFIVRVAPGVPANDLATLDLTITGSGWEADVTTCTADGFAPEMRLRVNRELGAPIIQWDFDDGTNQGFSHEEAHGTGFLSECDGSFFDFWLDDPVTDRSHSGSHSMRFGDGTIYGNNMDGGLVTPEMVVPAGGGALGFYTWLKTELLVDRLTSDGITLEAKDRAETTWSHLPTVTYNADVYTHGCDLQGDVRFPFGTNETVDLLAGDGDGTLTDGDTFDREHVADLTEWAETKMRVRFRFGSDNFFDDDPGESGEGVWIDTVTFYGPFVADSWPGEPPTGLASSDAQCPAELELTWNAVSGSGDYNVYRSTVSCADATTKSVVHGTASTPSFDDAAVAEGIVYHYAVEATEPGSGCPGERACVSESCACGGPPASPGGLLVDKQGDDVLLTWDDPATGVGFNVYREIDPDRTLWIAPHAAGVADADPGTAGIQHVDTGAVSAGQIFYYLITAETSCGESLL